MLRDAQTVFKSLDGGWLVALCAVAKACTCELPQARGGDCGGSMWDLVPLSKGSWEFLGKKKMIQNGERNPPWYFCFQSPKQLRKINNRPDCVCVCLSVCLSVCPSQAIPRKLLRS